MQFSLFLPRDEECEGLVVMARLPEGSAICSTASCVATAFSTSPASCRRPSRRIHILPSRTARRGHGICTDLLQPAPQSRRLQRRGNGIVKLLHDVRRSAFG